MQFDLQPQTVKMMVLEPAVHLLYLLYWRFSQLKTEDLLTVCVDQAVFHWFLYPGKLHLGV